jgi:hypothetical protein
MPRYGIRIREMTNRENTGGIGGLEKTGWGMI